VAWLVARGGNRQLNAAALHRIAVTRIRLDPKTRGYMAKKTSEGHSELEIIRCLKRYLAREIYYLLNPGRHVIPRRHTGAPRRPDPHNLSGSSTAAPSAGAQARSRWSTPPDDRP
jgi:hypothetical protein